MAHSTRAVREISETRSIVQIGRWKRNRDTRNETRNRLPSRRAQARSACARRWVSCGTSAAPRSARPSATSSRSTTPRPSRSSPKPKPRSSEREPPGARKFARKFTPTFVRTFRRQREIERRIMELNARNPETACPRVPPFAFHSAKARFAKCRDSPPASGDTSRFPTEKQAAWKEYQARNVRREYAKLTKDPHERGKLTETHRAHRAEKRRASKRAVAAGE